MLGVGSCSCRKFSDQFSTRRHHGASAPRDGVYAKWISRYGGESLRRNCKSGRCHRSAVVNKMSLPCPQCSRAEQPKEAITSTYATLS